MKKIKEERNWTLLLLSLLFILFFIFLISLTFDMWYYDDAEFRILLKVKNNEYQREDWILEVQIPKVLVEKVNFSSLKIVEAGKKVVLKHQLEKNKDNIKVYFVMQGIIRPNQERRFYIYFSNESISEVNTDIKIYNSSERLVINNSKMSITLDTAPNCLFCNDYEKHRTASNQNGVIKSVFFKKLNTEIIGDNYNSNIEFRWHYFPCSLICWKEQSWAWDLVNVNVFEGPLKTKVFLEYLKNESGSLYVNGTYNFIQIDPPTKIYVNITTYSGKSFFDWEILVNNKETNGFPGIPIEEDLSRLNFDRQYFSGSILIPENCTEKFCQKMTEGDDDLGGKKPANNEWFHDFYLTSKKIGIASFLLNPVDNCITGIVLRGNAYRAWQCNSSKIHQVFRIYIHEGDYREALLNYYASNNPPKIEFGNLEMRIK